VTSLAGSTARDALALAAAAGLLLLSGGGRAADSASLPGTSPAPHVPDVKDAHAAASASADLEEGRKILSRHCGSCHSPGLPTTSPGALAIFSLADDDWTAHMSPKQICTSERRLHGTSHEPAEVRAYTELIARLLDRHGAPPCGS
jgi:mono/diheme cytochrome c family protein